MEGFLSLPRSAKGGLAVLLAVALLGWAIVAYSAKRQHDDAQSRDQAIATLKSQEDQEKTAFLELESIQERLQAAETELATSQQAVATSHQEKSEIEARFANLQGELDALRLQPGETASDAESGDDGRTISTQPGSADAETLRARLTDTMTSLSAKNAMLQQRERALAKAEEANQAAMNEIESLMAAATERDALRARLTENMTTLSARNATVQQRERELQGLQVQLDEVMSSVETMEAASADQEAAGRSLDALTAKLGNTKQSLNDGVAALEKTEQALAEQRTRLQALKDEQASVEALIGERQAEANLQEQKLAELANNVSQEEQRLTERQEDVEATKVELSDLTSANEERALEGSNLSVELGSLEASLSEKEDAIAFAETKLATLQDDIANAEHQLSKKTSKLNAQDVELKGVEASLAALKADRAMTEAETVEIKTAMSRQQDALADLSALKGEIDETKTELALQTELLDEKLDEVAAVDTRLQTIRKASTTTDGERSLPRIPIADLSEDTVAILPIDPMQTPMPVQTDNGLRLSLIHFDLGSADLTPGGLRRAMEAAAWIKQQAADEKIRLIGSTDTIGTRADNLVLAKRRARSLLKVFADQGIDPARIELISKGETGGSEEIADQTAEPMNRCVGVFIGEG